MKNLVICKKCKFRAHDPKYAMCFTCAGVKLVDCPEGCERHSKNPMPTFCLDCMRAKRSYFQTHGGYTK